MAGTGSGATFDGSTIEGAAPRLAEAPGGDDLLAATLLSHADLERIGERALLGELSGRRPIALSRLEPFFAPPRRPAGAGGAPLGDRRISREPLRLERRPEGLTLHRDGHSQPLTLNGRPLEAGAIVSQAELEVGVVLGLGERAALLLHRVQREQPPAPDHGLLGDSDATENLRRHLGRLGPTPWPVLLRGETGSGKELAALALHRASGRGGPFLALNMAALPSGLAAAELFGARRGAYTQAVERRGLFAAATTGTLLLDEIGEASEEVQTLLLRCLEKGEVLPLGSEKPVAVDVRVIAATDARLEEAIAAGRFRAALFHRLAAASLELPPLRARRDDVPRLFLHFLRLELGQLGRPLPPSDAALETPFLSPRLAAELALHGWPGNVRELRNYARRCAIEWRGGPLAVHPETALASAPTAAPAEGLTRKPSELAKDEVVAALRDSGFEIKAAAAALGVSRPSFYAVLERFGLAPGASRLDDRRIADALEAAQGDAAAAARSLGVSGRALRRRLGELGPARNRHG